MPDPSTPQNDAPLGARWAADVRSRLASLRLSPAREAEIVDELSQHLDDRYNELVSGGASPEEATRLALADFHSENVLAQHMAALRQAHAPVPVTPGAPTGHLLDDLWQDLRYAARLLWKRSAFATTAVLTLALGIAATTAMFTFVDTFLFKPAPWNKAGGLVWIAGLKGRSTGSRNVSYPDYLVYRDRATTLSGVAASGNTPMSVGSRQPQRVLGGLASGNYFDVLQIRAQIGRTFTLDDDTELGPHPVVVLSDGLWRTQFGADPKVVDTVVTINGHPFTIIGVAPRGFTGIAYADDAEQLWVPMAMQPVAMPRSPGFLATSQSWLKVVGRLREEATIAQANAEVRVIARQLNPSGIAPDQEKSAHVLPVRGGLTPWEQDALAPVFALVSIVPVLVLLVACANAANVLMAHHVSRRREFAMRQAIGASRVRLVRQFVAESLIVAVLAGVAGFVLSYGLSTIVVHYGQVPAEVSRLLTPDLRALLAATTVAIGTVLVFGLAPAVTATRFDVLPALKDEGTTATASHGVARLRRGFVIAQVALSLTLVIAAGLFLQSLSRALSVHPGFDAHRLVTVSFDLHLQGYAPERRDTFVSRFLERASAVAGMTSVATADVLPLGGEMFLARVVAEDGSTVAQAARAGVSPGYFKTLDLSIVRGREFTPADVAADAPVAIVDETIARRLWPGSDPIGKRVQNSNEKEPWREVVGIARDAKFLSLTESARGTYYVPLRPAAATFVARTTGAPQAALAAMRDIARDLDPDLPASAAQTMDERIRRTVNLQRAVVAMLGVLGSLTLLLASVGIYGVAAHNVSMRTREVGIRMSLGARGGDVLRMIVRENFSLSLIGVAVGLGISIAGSMILASFLFGVTSTDAATFTGGAAILCVVTLLASYIPARRAAHLDPLLALRCE
ncbi:MAG TPA: ABC transporter permease [Vicinamibacterales bacterium]|jgi:putative ABC transport system permease protein|nr:ABC transporter permease [Vicinamibacterales bacterium]